MLVIVLVVALIVIAIGAGFFGSLVGLGGGVILTPLLVLLFGIPFGYAVGASTVSVLATSTTSGAAFVHSRLTDLRIGNFLQIATVPGALIGATVTVLIAHTSLVPVLLIVLGVVLLSPLLWGIALHEREDATEAPGDAISQRLRLRGSYYGLVRRRVVHYQAQNSTGALEVMFGAGFVAGLFGIGSGVLNVLALDRALRLPIKVATATSNFMIGVTATAGVGVLFIGGLVLPMLAAPVAIGTTVGAYVGSRTLPRLTNRLIRLTFFVVLIVLAIETIVRGVGGL
ncbi:MAG: sulfite exporter TauE/SafE family protein [Thermoplasmata archaeon]